MMKNLSVLLFLVLCTLCTKAQVRTEYLFEKGWKFTREDGTDFMKPGYDDARWQSVTIPHDWAIYGPFSIHNDQQKVAIVQDGQKAALEHAGRTGGLPFVGVGWYRLRFEAPAFTSSDKATLIFDGAMSHAKVYLNGHEIGYWPYGYNSFYLDATPYMKPGESNLLAVRLENETESSRWYPGAGLYRNVHLIVTDKVHVPVWGTQITTPHVSKDFAAVRLQTKIDNAGEKTQIRIETEILSPDGKVVTSKENTSRINHGQPFEQNFIVNAPELWSPESPSLYKAVSKIYADDNTSVVTSGSYQRYYTVDGKDYCHIIDKNTLYPANYFKSVTVISSDSALADTLSTALFCMDLNAGRKLAEKYNIQAIWLDKNDKITKTDGVKSAK